VFAEALIKTYEVHEEDPVRKCFFSVTRDEQNHEIMCGLAITRMLGHPDPLTYEPKTELGKRLQKNVQWLYFNGGATGPATSRPCPSTTWPCCSAPS
jgi:hypothetical protein